MEQIQEESGNRESGLIERVPPPPREENFLKRSEEVPQPIQSIFEDGTMSESVEQYGVNAMENCIDALGRMAKAAVDVFADGKITISDAKVIPAVTSAAWDLVKNIPQATKEALDIHGDEWRKLADRAFETIFNVKKPE